MPTHYQDGNIDFIVGQAKFSYDILRHLNQLFFAASVAWIICLLPGKDQLHGLYYYWIFAYWLYTNFRWL